MTLTSDHSGQQDTISQDTISQDTNSQDTNSQDTNSQDTNSQDTNSQDTISQDTISQDTISGYKDLVWRVYDTTFNQRNPAAARDCYAADYQCHTPLHPEGTIDVDGIEGDGDMVLTAVPDVTVTFADAFGQGDRLVVRHVFRGTHTGPLLGLPPSGRTVTVSGTDVYRIADGKIAEEWAQPDLFGLLQQIGALPPPPAAH